MFYEINVHFKFVGCLLFFLIISCTPETELEWNQEEGYQWAELRTSFRGKAGFREIPNSKTGISFSNDVGIEAIARNRHYLNGSGVAAADVNGNGLVDIYFASLKGSNKLYKNLGNYRFQDVTEEAGLAHEGFHSTGVVFADVNGNGYPDLLISSLSEGNILYINDGTGKFERKENSGLGESRGAHTMTLADVSGNGYPDLYITNYKIRTVRDQYSMEELSLENTVSTENGLMAVLPPFDEDFVIVQTEDGEFRNEKGEKDELYFNLGDGVFQKVDDLAHFFDEDGNPRGLSDDWGLTAKFVDVTGNQLPDLYVANDFWTPDRFWINQGDGSFRLIDTDAIRNMSFSSMGVDFSDMNRDGHLDFVVTEMLSRDHSMRLRQSSEYLPEFEGRTMHSRNSVYKNRGDNTFAQIAYYSGLEASEWSWATSFMDINLNGYEDLIVATGFGRDYQDIDTQIAMYERDAGISRGDGDILEYPELKLSNKIFRNHGDLTFSDVSEEWGFGAEDISLGMALADLNNNGTPDVIINRLNEEAVIYQNRTNAPRIAVRLKGISPNTGGIGAKIELKGGPVLQSKEMAAGGNYLSGSQAQVVFAAEKDSLHEIKVTWPGGRKSVVKNVIANRIYEIDESAAEKISENVENNIELPGLPLFEDISDRLNHTHHENEYDDFRFAPLLPLRLSTQGPGLAWMDITGNDYDDLLITSGAGGGLSIFENRGGDEFRPVELPPITGQTSGDQTSIIGWKEDGKTKIVTGSANYEQGNPHVPSAFIYSVDSNGEVEVDEIPGILSTTGPVAAADYTGNGYLDLFIGGRHKPGQYPVDADSRLFINDRGAFLSDEQNSALLANLGLITDALFADFTGNGHQDLLVSSEWGTLRLFENNSGRFREITAQSGLSGYRGWWKGITIGDFTNNGLPDIVALNIGLNTPYQIRGDRPLRMYYDDFNWDGRLNILDSYYDEDAGGWVPRRKLHDFESVSTILRNVSSHREYAASTVEYIFDQSFSEVPYKEINTLQHLVFINTGEGFEARPLPQKAQFSSAFFGGVADFDNDGNEDLFITQNFFGFPGEQVPRLDAGRGLLLKGDGMGNFEPVPGSKSGIKVYGEQRGAALADINRNGKVDLVVGQNNSKTKLFKNRTREPGLQIYLQGPESNKSALGSSIRLIYTDGSEGARRFISAGSGYSSQNSTMQVLGRAKPVSAIEVQWFDGRTEQVQISDDQEQITVVY